MAPKFCRVFSFLFVYFSGSFTRLVMSVGCRPTCAGHSGLFEAGCAPGSIGAPCPHDLPPTDKMTISCFIACKKITRQEKEPLKRKNMKKHGAETKQNEKTREKKSDNIGTAKCSWPSLALYQARPAVMHQGWACGVRDENGGGRRDWPGFRRRQRPR